MFDADARDRTRSERSLLSLGQRAPEAEEAASPADQDRSVRRRRLAGSRREMRPSPILAALAGNASEPDLASLRPASHEAAWTAGAETFEEPARTPEASPGWVDRLFGWARRDPQRDEDADAATTETTFFADAEAQPAGWPAELVRSPTEPRTTEPDFVEDWPLLGPVHVARRVAYSKRLILSTSLVGALIGVAIALSTPNRYEAVAEIMVDPRDLQLAEPGASAAGLPSDALAIVENQVRVLTSGRVLSQVVDRLNLADDPEFNGQASGFELSPGALLSRLRGLLAPQTDPADAGRLVQLATEHLFKTLTVERGGKTFVISVGAVTQSPQKSALVANTVVDAFVLASGELQSDTAGRAAEKLTGRLDQLRADLEAAERKVQAFKAENDIIDAQGRLITDDEIVRLNEQLANARARTLDLNARAESARAVDVDAVISGDLPEQVASGAMAELRAQYTRFKQEVDSLGVRLGPRHPQRMAAEAQFEGLREEIGNELRRIASSLQVELKRAVQLEQELASRLAQLKVRQGELGSELVTLRELERDATAKRAVYEAFLLRARGTGERSGIGKADISIISTASAPLVPVGPSRLTLALAGLGIGFLSGASLAGLRGAFESIGGGGSSSSRRRDEDEDGPRLADASARFDEAQEAAAPALDPVRGPFSSTDDSVPSFTQPAGEASPGDYPMRNLYPQQAATEVQSHPAYVAYPQPYAAAYPYPPVPAEPGMIWVQAPAYQHPQHQAQQPAAPVNAAQTAAPVNPSQHVWPQNAMPPAYAQQPAWYPAPPPALYQAPHLVAAQQRAEQQHAEQQAEQRRAEQAQAEQLQAEQQAQEEEQQASMEEIRASLREFREAVRELTETRQRRRYF